MKNKQLFYAFALLVFVSGQLNAGAPCQTINNCPFVVEFKEIRAECKAEFEKEQQRIREMIAAQLQEYQELELKADELNEDERLQKGSLYLKISYGHLAFNFARYHHLTRQQEALEKLLIKHRAALVPLLEQAQRALEGKDSGQLPSDSLKPIRYALATVGSSSTYPTTFDDLVNGDVVRAALESRLQLLSIPD